MKIKQITENKEKYLNLLLLADPGIDMINKYIDKGEMFVMEDNGRVVCQAVVISLNDSICELKNISVDEKSRNKGYGTKMLAFLFSHYGGWFDKMIVGTARDGGGFYKKNGFTYSHAVKNFFKDNYDEPVLDEDGKEYRDMFYYEKHIG